MSGLGGNPLGEDRLGRAGLWPVALLLAYPPAWRARYGDELEDLVRDLHTHGRRPLPMAADLLRGAAIAWLIERRTRMSERSRSALSVVLWSWVAFAATAAWFGHDLAIYPNASAARQIAQAHPGVPDAYHILLAAGIVGVAATAVAALVFAIGAVRHAERHGRRSTYFLTAVPPVVAGIWIGGLQLLPTGNGSPHGFAVVWMFAGVAGIAVSTQAVLSVVRNSEFDPMTWRIGAAMAAAVVAAMIVATGATIAWGLVLHSSQPHLGDSGNWLLVTTIMAVTTGRAVLALLGSRRSAAEQPAVA